MKATNVRTVSLVISVPHVLMASGGMPRQALVWKMLRTPDRSVRRSTSVKKELAAVIQIHSVSTQTWVDMHLLLFNCVLHDAWVLRRGYTVFFSCSQWDPPRSGSLATRRPTYSDDFPFSGGCSCSFPSLDAHPSTSFYSLGCLGVRSPRRSMLCRCYFTLSFLLSLS